VAAIHGSKAKIYTNGYDLSAFLNQAGLSNQADTAEVTHFGDTDKRYIPGLRDATLPIQGFFDGSVDAIDVVLNAAFGGPGSSPIVFSLLFNDDVFGSFGYGYSAYQTRYDVETSISDAAKITGEAQSNIGRERLVILHPLAAKTAPGNSTNVDNAVLTTAGGVGYFQLTALTGTNITLEVEHSVDNSVWTSLITTGALTTARQGLRVPVSGTVNRHVRARWSGTFTNATFWVGFSRTGT
jgi:hypothetical protein